jgi:hypothetical protein
MSDLSLPAADLLVAPRVALVIPSVLYGMYLVTLRIAGFLLLSTHAGRDPAMWSTTAFASLLERMPSSQIVI